MYYYTKVAFLIFWLELAATYLGGRSKITGFKIKKVLLLGGRLGQGELQKWTEHSHTDLPKSETSRDIKKSF